MDVGGWSWRWRLAGGVAVAVGTPYCFKTLVQINWEARENIEVVAPWLIQFVRENYGFPDEDPERRAHIARMEQLYAEDVLVSVSRLSPLSTAEWSGAVPGVTSAAALAAAVAAQSGPDAGALAAQQADACVRFEDAAEAPSVEAPAEAAAEAAAAAGGWWKSAVVEGDDLTTAAPNDADAAAAALDLQRLLNVVRSTWEVDEVAGAAAEREVEAAAQLLPHEAAQRALVRDLIAVAPLAPAFQTQQQQQPHAGGSAAAVAGAASASTAATRAAPSRRHADADAQLQVEAGLRASIAALEAERRSGDSARPIDDLDAELARLRAHLKAHRGWRLW